MLLLSNSRGEKTTEQPVNPPNITDSSDPSDPEVRPAKKKYDVSFFDEANVLLSKTEYTEGKC